jgi:hypothetical protein
MSRLDVMDYTADFIRGWPNDGALESSTYTIASGVDLEAGDLVSLNASGELILNAAESSFAGIVVRGNLDDKSVEAAGKAIVLWGGYIVRTTKIDAAVMGGAPMDSVNAVAGGVFDLATADAGTLDHAEAVMGHVLELVPGVNGNPDSAVIVVR